MAKPAKTPEPEVTERIANKFLKDVLEHFENIETARGVYMNKARKERESMTAIYETMAQKGISQKVSKTNVKIARALAKIAGWLSDLEHDDRKMAQKLAKLQNDKKQLLLFGELPPLKKPTKAEREAEREAQATWPPVDLDAQAPTAGEA